MTPKPWENAEGYTDPTAYTALRHIQQEENAELDAKVNTLIRVGGVFDEKSDCH